MDITQNAPMPRILVVEDEPLLRLMNADLLSEAGYEVVEAGNAHEALDVLTCHDDIKVVFTDVEMPGELNGFDLADTIEQRWPSIGILVTSGRCYPERLSASAQRVFLPKPFSVIKVVDLIEGLMRAH